MKEIHNFKIGDSVVVKENVKDPDFDRTIGGWQGRILDIYDTDELVAVEWDSLTLENMPGSLIDQCEEDGFDWQQMTLELSDIELTSSRDTEKDVKKMVKKIESEHTYSFLGKQGLRINKVLASVKRKDEWDAMEAWGNHLEKVLLFPFNAEIAEPQDYGSPDYGDKVTVKEISDIDDLYGVIVKIKYGRQILRFPLCDLEVCPKKSPNYMHVYDYVVWFANR